MEKDRIYFKDLQCWQEAINRGEKTKANDSYFDLLRLPGDKMREEMRDYILDRGRTVSRSTVQHDCTYYRQIVVFLDQTQFKRQRSFLDLPIEKWLLFLKKWMLQNGKPITCEKRNVYGKLNVADAPQIRYLRNILEFIQPEDMREEIEKDIWRLEALDIELQGSPTYNVETINFSKISQPDIREETKKIIYFNLKHEAVGTVQGEMRAIRKFSHYLKKAYPNVESCQEITRDILEGFLISLSTAETTHKGNSTMVLSLRRVLEGIGKIYQYETLEHLFLNTDIPPEVQPEFKVYSDAEFKRLNAHITKMDEQIARCMVIHQMLGTRISDTLTLRKDCLYKENNQDMIRIKQVKTSDFCKPISEELAELIQQAILYDEKFKNDSEYIFVNEENPRRPMQYTTIKHKVLGMILKEDLRDDQGNLFKFRSHFFRHYYGVKLTEMHLDDWTIARLLGHKKLSSVQHYRKMSNQTMADETREVRKMMTKIIYANLEGWGEEYEQIR